MKWFFFLIFAVAVWYIISPLMVPGFFVSDDGEWMIIRFSAFYQSLREGQFPVRFLGRLNYSYGYPVSNFLYPGFMYFGSIIHYIGISFVDTVKIILGSSIVITGLFSFLWLRVYFPSWISFVGSFSLVTNPYLLFDLYKRGSVGEILAFSWIAMGLYSISAKKPWILAPAVALLILSHNSVAFLFVLLFVLYITITRSWRENWFMFLLGLGISAFFWFPAFYDQKYILFNTIHVSNPAEYFVMGKYASLLGWGTVVAAISANSLKNKYLPEKTLFFIVFAVCLFLVFPISQFIWNISFVSRIIQFPFRLLSLVMFLGAWFVGFFLFSIEKRWKILGACIFIVLGVTTAIPQIQSVQHIVRSEGFYTTNEGTTTVQDEYMPLWASKKPTVHADTRMFFYTGRGIFKPTTESLQSIDTVVIAEEESEVQINSLYFPGWGATLDGIKTTINYDNPLGVMRIRIGPGTHRLTVAFRETITRFISDCVSLISGLTYVTYILWKYILIQKKQK